LVGNLARPLFNKLGIDLGGQLSARLSPDGKSVSGEPRNDVREERRGKFGRQDLDTSDENATKLRPTIISHMIYSEDKLAINTCLAEFTKHRHSLSEIAGDLRPAILAAVVKFGDQESFDYLLDLYKTSSDADLKEDIRSGLTTAREQAQIDRLIRQLTLTDVVRPQDLFGWFARLLGNRHARAKTWSWCRENWPWIVKTFGGDKTFDTFPRYLGSRLRTAAELREFDEFFADKKDEPALTRAIALGYTDIAARVVWLGRDQDEVLNRLESIQWKQLY
jgi:aminopeptidase N